MYGLVIRTKLTCDSAGKPQKVTPIIIRVEQFKVEVMLDNCKNDSGVLLEMDTTGKLLGYIYQENKENPIKKQLIQEKES